MKLVKKKIENITHPQITFDVDFNDDGEMIVKIISRQPKDMIEYELTLEGDEIEKINWHLNHFYL